MKNYKAFTLVELLAVIVILGLLSVLIVPKVINTLNESEQKTNMASANGLLKAAEYKYQDNEIKGVSENITIDFTTKQNIEKLDYTGTKPEIGALKIKNNGQVAMAVKIGDYCYKKNYAENEITVIPYNEATCVNLAEIPETVTSGDGLYESETEPGRLIYRGQNPNNYITLKEDGTNDTLYRIVSYETDGTIKVVRSKKLSSTMSWDNANSRSTSNNSFCIAPSVGCNVWGKGSNTLYNGEALGDSFHYIYYTSPTATTLSNGTSGTVTSDSTLNTYLNGTWLTSNLSNYIDNHSWNVGGVYYTSSDKGIIKEKEEERQLQWIGKVALLNITEYVEASTNPECTSVRRNYDSSSGSPCKTNNWTIHNDNSYFQWTISSYSNGQVAVWLVTSTGFFNNNPAYFSNGVHPAFYLKANIGLIGEGTETNPYHIID